MIQCFNRKVLATFLWASKYTNSRKRSVNLYKPYQYKFVPCCRWFTSGTGGCLTRDYIGCSFLQSRRSVSIFYYTELPSKHYIHLTKVKDRILQHLTEVQASVDVIIAHIKLYQSPFITVQYKNSNLKNTKSQNS